MAQNFKRAVLMAGASLLVCGTALSGALAADSKPDAARAVAWAALAKLPDWTEGVWQIDWQSLFAPGGRSAPPSLTPEHAAKLKAFQESQARGENVQTEYANCVPPGVPQIMTMPYPIEFLYSPGRVTIAIETDSQVRRIYTDGTKLPDDPDLTFNGDSIGHWEGDTLVAETVGLEPRTMIAPGVGHSERMRVTERFHQVGPDRLEITTTITDPEVLTEPWTVTRPYIRQRDWRIKEYVCQQNNRDYADDQGRAGIVLDK
jgi:hypothetical protein